MSLEQLAEETPLEEGFVEEGIEEAANEVVDEAPEYTEIEQEAINNGWNPNGVDGKDHIPAKEFMERKPLYDRLHKLEKKNKQLDEAVKATLEHDRLMRKNMHERHVKELEKARAEAFENADKEGFDKADKELREAEKARAEEEVSTTTTAEDTQEIFKEWAGENDWYGANTRLSKFADTAAMAYQAQNPDISFQDVLKHVDKEVRDTFPEEFKGKVPMKEKAPAVEASTRGNTGRRRNKAPSAKDLPEEVLSVAKTLVRSGTFKDLDAYATEYFAQTGE